jgi:hypothetical protein
MGQPALGDFKVSLLAQWPARRRPDAGSNIADDGVGLWDISLAHQAQDKLERAACDIDQSPSPASPVGSKQGLPIVCRASKEGAIEVCEEGDHLSFFCEYLYKYKNPKKKAAQ